MTLNLSTPQTETDLKPRIIVVGVGGAGCNAVNNMIDAQLGGVEFVVANTDAQSLAQNKADRRVQLGAKITNGLGAGARPDIGQAVAEEAMDAIIDHLQSSHMAFITAGMGGGTGTGAAPVIARAARELGILTVGVVTRPFQFEGVHRMTLADDGIEELQHFVDTLIVIPNQNLFRVCNEKTTFADAFRMADDVLYSGVRGVTDLMVMPGLINLDFADIRTVMSEMGKAMMGTGEATGEKRAIESAEAAIANPLLDDVSMKGAKAVLINITGGPDMTLFEVDEAANRIREEVDPVANIIFGSTFDESLDGMMRVSLVATGIDAEASAMPRPAISLVHDVDRGAPATIDDAGTEPAPLPAPATTATTTAMPDGEMPASFHEAAAPVPAGAPIAAPTAEAAEAAGTTGGEPPTMPTMASGPSGSAVAGSALAMAAAPEPFIAPPAVAPPAEVERARTRPPADPFAIAAMANGAAERAKRRGFGLFQRVTGPRARRDDAPPILDEPAEPRLEEPVVRRASAAPRTPPGPPPGPTGTKPQAQPNLGGLEPATRKSAHDEEEDLLEIPAFLRRQAN